MMKSGYACETPAGSGRLLSRCAFALIFLLALVPVKLCADLVPLGSNWSYRDDGSDQGTAWKERAFDDVP